jgi:signal transduction histidine kinase
MSDLVGMHASSTNEGLGGGTLTHDVRQSLAVLRSLATLVEATPLLQEETVERVRLIQHELDWISEMVGSAAGSPAAGDRLVDVGAVVADVTGPFLATAACQVRLRTDEDVWVAADTIGLVRATRNLVDNAVRAAGVDGRVEVRVRRLGAEAAIEVADDGPGFGRVPTQQGLGLVTVRRFAARCRGALEVGASGLGGALLTLRLPLATAAVLPEQRRPA